MTLPEPNCFECERHVMCFIHRDIQDVINRAIQFVTVDYSESNKKSYQFIYSALANTCVMYEERKKDG